LIDSGVAGNRYRLHATPDFVLGFTHSTDFAVVGYFSPCRVKNNPQKRLYEQTEICKAHLM
jgi:hypothetical protein